MKKTPGQVEQGDREPDCSEIIESLLAKAPPCYDTFSDQFSYILSCTDALTWQQVYAYLLAKENK